MMKTFCHLLISAIFFLLISGLANNAAARGTYLTTEQFLAQAFNNQTPETKVIWLTQEDKAAIEEIMQHQVRLLRVRYWQLNNETAWILEEIGKEKPITIGIHIQAQQIKQLTVLTFRESRGDEVRHKFFTDQFNEVKLTKENMLTEHIDGITGATMSVRALTKVARLALWLNNKVKHS